MNESSIKNILNLNKYTVERNKNYYMAAFLFTAAGSFVITPHNVGFYLCLNLIIILDMFTEVKRTRDQISGKKASFLFLTPITNLEFITAKILKIFVLFMASVFSGLVMNITVGEIDFLKIFSSSKASGLSIKFASSTFYFALYLLFSIIIISSSTLDSRKRRIYFILSIIIYIFLIHNVVGTLINFLPDINVTIIKDLKINIVSLIIKGFLFFLLGYKSLKIMNKKLDIK